RSVPAAAATLTATATDSEEGDLAGPTAWTSDRDGTLGMGGSITASALSAGIHTITASATDSSGKPGSMQVIVTVNTPPVVTITAPPAGTSPEPLAGVTFAATATDAEDGNLASAITWTSSRDGALGTGGTLTTSTLSTGTHTIRATVTDSNGKQASATLTVVVNTTPTVHILTPADGARLEPVPSTFAGTASDPEDGDVSSTIDWASDRDGHLGSGATIVASLSSGTHVITASVIDAGGKRAATTITIVVNATPTVTIGAPATGSTFEHGAPITFIATASDLEDGSLTAAIAWTSSRDGVLGTGGTITTSALSTGTHVLTASATDHGGKTGRASVIITINTTPAVTITAPANNATYELAAAVTLSGTATDVEDGTLTTHLTWTSSRDGSLGSGSTITISTLTSGTHTITATVTDSGGKTAHTMITITVDATPVVAITAPAGTTFEPGAAITFTGSATDTEDGTLTSRITWTSNRDGLLGTGATITV